MRAAVWRGPGRPLTVEELPTPQVEEPEDVVLRVRAAMFGAALVRAVTVGHPRLSPPAVLGTLVVGDVVDTGSAVRHLKPDQRVTLDPHPPCGHCANCRDGLRALCDTRISISPGAHAQYVRIRPPVATHARTVPPELSAGAALLTEIVACVLDATDTSGIGPGQDVLVIGCGPVGLIQVQLARLRGARRVFCSVNHPGRRELVDRAGGIPVDAQDLSADHLAVLTAGRGPHVVVEAVGSATTYACAFDVVRDGGTVIGFGGCPPGTTVPLDVNAVHYRRIRFIGSYHYEPGVFEKAARLLETGQVDLEPLLTHRIPLDRIADAVTTARRSDCLVPIIEP
ncbi:zinc-binding dehydrogenase [Streptomyces sp. SID8352]|uniref:zinc-dependent alcohol dehydrogenase n=1 Tax=Streptomyces sp. SID8352 TaxID=2690338 RepID=UPI0013709AE0|nr:zinc-binding dehydrogenase [Streptomyces sp. SID8352]MYU23646.1 zinc-binding dehydrogenase [Streptomyces sp. SID8352]